MIEKEIIVDNQNVKVAIKMEDGMFDNNNVIDFEKTMDLTNIVKKVKKEKKAKNKDKKEMSDNNE